jgi:hypothetical protein
MAVAFPGLVQFSILLPEQMIICELSKSTIVLKTSESKFSVWSYVKISSNNVDRSPPESIFCESRRKAS